MTEIFQLLYKTNDQNWHDVLFSNEDEAKHDLERYYYIGALVFDNLIVENSIIISRILF